MDAGFSRDERQPEARHFYRYWLTTRKVRVSDRDRIGVWVIVMIWFRA